MSIAFSLGSVKPKCKLVREGPLHTRFASLLHNRAHLACLRTSGPIAISTVLAVAASAGPSLVQRAPTPSPINLGIPSTLEANASQSLGPYFVSFSIEPAFLDELVLGNKSNPNTLSRK